MTLTTTETVTVDGVVLNTLAYNIETLTGRDALPPIRGENGPMAYRTGRTWRRKRFEQKQETWAMWVRGCDEDGAIPAHGARAEYNANLLKLKTLFGVRHRQLVLERKVLMPSGLLVLSALGEGVGVMEPGMVMGQTLARFSVDMELATPFWFGPSQAHTIDAGTPEVINNPGSAIAEHMVLRVHGPTNAPTIINTTSGAWVRYTGNLLDAQWVDIDTSDYSATGYMGSNEISKIEYGGAVPFMELLPGDNTLTMSSSGSTVLTFKPPYA